MSDTSLHTWFYEGEKIIVNEYGLFIALPNDDNDRHEFNSLDQAKEHVDAILKQRAKAARESVAIPAIIVSNGSWRQVARQIETTVVGIHGRLGNLLFKPSLGKDVTADEVYLKHPAVRTLLEQRTALREQIAALEKQLEEYRLHGSRSYGNINTDGHIQLIGELRAVVAKHDPDKSEEPARVDA